mmetsp:Transcript_14338/g.42804  ORF Transcript_14338/g.42804 Transcript_14338/m.42804 type:complete len:421 (-) Transcript_14338:48-1310(-)
MPATTNAALAALVALHAYSFVAVPPIPLNVIVTATSLLYVGSARALVALRKDAAAPDAPPEEVMRLTTREAAQFPIVGSIALVSAYGLIKLFGRALLNMLLSAYFVSVGLFAVEAFLEGLVGASGEVVLGDVVRLKAWAARLADQDTVDLRLTKPQAGCWAAAALVLGAYWATKHWALNNLVACCLCVSGMEIVSIGSFKNAAIMLCGLFVYDVWWVFGTDVMVTVAKGVDGPIKLLFVREPLPGDDPLMGSFSMLGLGDIVVPGLFVALLLRFDAERTAAKAGAAVGDFPAPYFRTALVAYAGGLALTLWVMAYFDAAQPALLYLVPAGLLAALGTGAWRGELGALIAFDEGGEEPAEAADIGGIERRVLERHAKEHRGATPLKKAPATPKRRAASPTPRRSARLASQASPAVGLRARR